MYKMKTLLGVKGIAQGGLRAYFAFVRPIYGNPRNTWCIIWVMPQNNKKASKLFLSLLSLQEISSILQELKRVEKQLQGKFILN